MRYYIESCHKESERRVSYPEQSTAHGENVANITVVSASVIKQEKKKWECGILSAEFLRQK